MPPDDMSLKVAILENNMSHMNKSIDALARLTEETNKELREIRDLVAQGKGAWWAVAGLVGLLAAIAGGAGAVIHKLFP